MRQKSQSKDLSSEEIVKGIRRATRKRYSPAWQTAGRLPALKRRYGIPGEPASGVGR
jgi:hypothetical protein